MRRWPRCATGEGFGAPKLPSSAIVGVLTTDLGWPEMVDQPMGEPPANVLRSADLKRRGLAAVEEALLAGPVHLLRRDRPAAVVLSAEDYGRLQPGAVPPATASPSCLEWVLELPPAPAGRSRDAIHAELDEQRDW
jgi:hypothetical protein